jgi:hypothetical protein
LDKKLTALGFKNGAAVSMMAIADLSAIEGLAARTARAEPDTDTEKNKYLDQKSSLLKALAHHLNEAIKDKHIKNITFKNEGGCGAGELFYRIAVSPPQAKVHIIKAFYFLLCQAKGIDPLDLQSCYGWQDVLTGKMEGAGLYKYLAVLPNGKQQSGGFEVTEADLDSMDNTKLNVVRIDINND